MVLEKYHRRIVAAMGIPVPDEQEPSPAFFAELLDACEHIDDYSNDNAIADMENAIAELERAQHECPIESCPIGIATDTVAYKQLEDKIRAIDSSISHIREGAMGRLFMLSLAERYYLQERAESYKDISKAGKLCFLTAQYISMRVKLLMEKAPKYPPLRELISP